MDDEQVITLGACGLMPALERVHEEVEARLTLGPRCLVVDVSEISDLSSTTVAALLWIRRRCSERGVEVALRGVAGRHRDALLRIGFVRELGRSSGR